MARKTGKKPSGKAAVPAAAGRAGAIGKGRVPREEKPVTGQESLSRQTQGGRVQQGLGRVGEKIESGRADEMGKGSVLADPGRPGAMEKAAVPRGKDSVLAESGRGGEIARAGNLLVLGSVALDSVKTPFGEVSEVLGGSASFFATAASYFTAVSVIAVVGEDFPERHLDFLRQRDIDLTGLERRQGKTFRWRGEYSYQLNEAKTLDTQLNVFETFRPHVPASHQSPDMF